MPPAPQSSGSRFPIFCCLGVHWASWLAPGWSWGSMFCSLGGSWGSWFAPGWSLGFMFSIAYGYCTSSFHMFIAYLYRITLLRIFIAYVYCISLLHISVAYLYCISILHISVAVLLSFVAWVLGSMFGRLGLDLGVILEGFWGAQIDHFWHQNFMDFCVSFQERPKSSQKRPKSGPGRHKSGQERPKSDQERSKRGLGAVLGPFGRRFGAILASKT